MAKTLQDSSSKRHFHWTNKVKHQEEEEEDHHDHHAPLPSLPAKQAKLPQLQRRRRHLQAAAISRLRSVVLNALGQNRATTSPPLIGLGTRVVGTLFGSKKGHVHFALQRHPTAHPAFLIELATPISGLVKEMASGLVRIALECDKSNEEDKRIIPEAKTTTRRARLLLEEPKWRTYCNGKKSGFASKRECGEREWRVLRAVGPISMGAGVLPGCDDNDEEDEVMYMRAKFERVVGSRDSEAFYMMNPDSNGAPELSIYLLRV